jgi:arginyl-tRNA--protein-N-Asp/Glu arginylyltransferase
MVLARLSTAGMRINAEKSKFFTEQTEYLGYWITKKESNQYKVRWKPFLRSRLQQPERKYAYSWA